MSGNPGKGNDQTRSSGFCHSGFCTASRLHQVVIFRHPPSVLRRASALTATATFPIKEKSGPTHFTLQSPPSGTGGFSDFSRFRATLTLGSLGLGGAVGGWSQRERTRALLAEHHKHPYRDLVAQSARRRGGGRGIESNPTVTPCVQRSRGALLENRVPPFLAQNGVGSRPGRRLTHGVPRAAHAWWRPEAVPRT